MSRRAVLHAVAERLEAAGFEVEVHLGMTEFFIIRGAANGSIFMAGTNLETWGADCYPSEAAFAAGEATPGAGFSTDLSSGEPSAAPIAVALLHALDCALLEG